MSFFDFFRNFLSSKRRNEPSLNSFGDYDSHRESFRNPIWQSDEDDDDDNDNFRHPKSGLYFNVFSNPLEMTFYFESQMDNMLKEFFKFNSTFFSMFENDERTLRDRMLKSKLDTFATDIPSENRVDTNLDGRVSAEEFSKMWNKGNMQTKPSVQSNFSFGKSIIIRKPDGTIEKKQIIRDSKGNEETIISKEEDGKTFVVTIKKDKNGIETKSEDLFNMDESELKDFHQKWKSSVKENVDDNDSFNRFPWEKFFGPNPKL